MKITVVSLPPIRASGIDLGCHCSSAAHLDAIVAFAARTIRSRLHDDLVTTASAFGGISCVSDR
jgi:hypothetical protein